MARRALRAPIQLLLQRAERRAVALALPRWLRSAMVPDLARMLERSPAEHTSAAQSPAWAIALSTLNVLTVATVPPVSAKSSSPTEPAAPVTVSAKADSASTESAAAPLAPGNVKHATSRVRLVRVLRLPGHHMGAGLLVPVTVPLVGVSVTALRRRHAFTRGLRLLVGTPSAPTVERRSSRPATGQALARPSRRKTAGNMCAGTIFVWVIVLPTPNARPTAIARRAFAPSSSNRELPAPVKINVKAGTASTESAATALVLDNARLVTSKAKKGLANRRSARRTEPAPPVRTTGPCAAARVMAFSAASAPTLQSKCNVEHLPAKTA